jgi:hypothetical protein
VFRRYERAGEPVASRRRFLQRLSGHGAVATIIVGTWLSVGMAGYAAFANMGPVDAFVNAAMIASGMGPPGPFEGDTDAKLFAGIYALASGLLLVALTGLLLSPFLHRILHRLHFSGADDESDG